MKVAAYTIALNEAAHVDMWAKSTTDADYRIVADTGSTDDTVDRLTRAGVTVYRIAVRPWRFDVARNTALALIPADVDVCLSMDMDEFVEAGWRSKLETAWSPGTTALYCRKQSRSHADAPPANGFPVKNFHHRWGYHFKRPVHEQLSYSGENEITHYCADIIINHVQDHSKTTRKQYLPLMELARKEDPGDAQICFWLGREYMWAKQNKQGVEAMECYLALLSSTWPEERSEAMRCLARMQSEKRMFWLDKARTEAPHRREIWLDLAEELYERQDWAKLFWACTNGIEKTRRTGSYLDDQYCWGSRLFDLGAMASWELKLIDRAIEWQQTAVELAPDDHRLRLQNSLDFFIRQHEMLRRNDDLATPSRSLLLCKTRKRDGTSGGNETNGTATNREGRVEASSQSSEQSSNSGSVLSQLEVRHEFERLDLAAQTQPTALCELILSYGSDKAGPFHNYTIFYERLFSKFREEKLEIFELGIGTNKADVPSSMGPRGKPGASLRAWRAYFESANIYAADIDRDTLFAEDRIQTFWVDQRKPDTIRALWRQLDGISFDIMIDDGLHDASANISFFLKSLQKLKPGGIYMVENIRPTDAGIMKSFVHTVAHVGKYAIVAALPHPLNNVDNRLMIFQNA